MTRSGVLLAFVLACAVPASAGPRGVDLLAASPSGIRLGVTVPEFELVPVAGGLGGVTPRLPGWETAGRPGTPALPERVIYVAVPPEGDVTVRAVATGSAVSEGVELEAAPRIDPAVSRPTDGSLVRERDAEVYRSPAPVAPDRARLTGISWLRNQRVAAIVVKPLDYEPAARRLTRWARIEIEVGVQDRGGAGGIEPTPDAFEPVYAATLPNYEQGKRWRRSPSASPAGRPGAPRTSLQPNQVEAINTASVIGGRRWLRLAIPRSGFYRVTFSQLRTLAPFSDGPGVPFDSLYVYAWPGLPMLVEGSFCDSCDYRELPLGIEDAGADGRMSTNADAITFFALGPADWGDRYDPAVPDTIHVNTPYDRNNYVFLTYDRSGAPFGEKPFGAKSKRIPLVDAQVNVDGSENTPARFTTRLHFESDTPTEYYPNLAPAVLGRGPQDLRLQWEKFFWRGLQVDGNFSFSFRAPGVDRTQPAIVRVRAWGLANRGDCFVSGVGAHNLDLLVGPDSARVGWFSSYPITATLSTVLDSANLVRVKVPRIAACPSRVDQTEIAWIEVRYPRLFQPENDSLRIETDGNGNAIYQVGPFSSATPPRVFDTTDPFAPRELVGFSYVAVPGTPVTYSLSFEVTEAGPSRYELLPSAKINKPAATDFSEASDKSLEDLRATDRQADYILIYYDGFRAAADSLVAWRRTRLPIDGDPGPYEAVAVPTSAIYDQFGGGRTDPTALRNFLRAAYYNWRAAGHAPPSFVTLMGDASFDFKNLYGLAGAGQPGTLVPTYENGFSGGQFATDDWLTNVDNPLVVLPDYFSGRIPVPDPASALDFVRHRLLPYERSAPTGSYRNRILLIADDDLQGQEDDPLHWKHLKQTAELDTLYTPDHFDREYVYLHTYPDGPGRTKPLAKAGIKDVVNLEGVALFNYFGHGSPFKLSDENVLIDTDAGTFTNATRLPFFVAASCDVGKYNDPRVQSLGERLLLAPSGGTIGVISATEIAYADLNANLAYEFYERLFDRAVGGVFRNGVGPALLGAKLATGTEGFSITNNEKYQIMGDAGLRLNLPRLWVELALYDATGTSPVSEIRGGQTLTYRGRVVDRPGGAAVAYQGVVDLLIEDSQPRPTSPPCQLQPTCPKTQYDFRAGAIFRGDALVTGGNFEGRFVVPLESLPGARGKVRAYVQGLPGAAALQDGVGSLRMQVSPGSMPPGDTEGPTISLSFPGGVTSVRPNAVMRVDLSDPSGILTTGHTLQNGIVVTVDGNTTARVDITSSFRYAAGSFTTGTAYFALPNLAAGPHVVKATAADNLAGGLTAFQHRSTATLAFEVVSEPPIRIRTAYLFPNPTESGRATSGGTFVVDGPGDSVNVMVRLFTVSGRMIRELTAFGGFGQVQVPWDGLDAEGYPLANGTYLFKVYVNGRDERGRSSARSKDAADGRFVILNR